MPHIDLMDVIDEKNTKVPKKFRLLDIEAQEYGQPPAFNCQSIIEESDNGRKIKVMKGEGAR